MSPGIPEEVAFISGVNADGTLALQSFASWNDGTNPADYSGGSSPVPKWGANTAGTAGGTVKYYFNPASGWNATEQQFLAAGLALWSDIANISFVATTDPSQAQITFTRGSDGSSQTTGTFSAVAGAGQTGGTKTLTFTTATVSIDTGVAGFGPINGSFLTDGGAPINTFIHEEGHAIGLGHAGPYNSSADATTQQFSPYDSRQWSVMSYFLPSTTSAKYFNQYPVTGTSWGVGANNFYNEPTTWMPLDILAAQRLYGLPVSTPLSGGQTFGFNSNIAGPSGMFFDFTKNTNPVVTLWDMGTNNTLDLSGFTAQSTVNLNPGTFSSVDGMTNNIAIAFNTAIDRVIGGSGSNIIVGNNDGDYLKGGDRDDAITGGTGNDTLAGGLGNNTLNGGGGVNTAQFSGARGTYVTTLNSNGTVTVSSGPAETDTLTNIQFLAFADGTFSISIVSNHPNGDLDGNGDGDIVWQDPDGQPVIWLMANQSILQAAEPPTPGMNWRIISTGDFDGDGKADILWQNINGQISIWTMNGSLPTAMTTLGGNPGTDWKVIGTGDFNGDGKADILFQNTNGTAAVRLMNGTSLISDAYAGDPGKAWRAIGSGDFNGDGKSDILWQNSISGQAAIWFMNGTSLVSDAYAGGNPGTDWKVIGAADFDGDGKADILWQNRQGQAAIWLMNGATPLSEVRVGSALGSDWQIGGISDLNGDGKSDILWKNGINGQLQTWLMNGTTVTSSATNYFVAGQIAGDRPAVISKDDFNGDSFADLTWQNSNGQPMMWLMNGSTVLSSSSVDGNPGAGWRLVGSGDFNIDGYADMLWQNSSSQAAIWYMNGSTPILESRVSGVPGTDWTIVSSGDFDGDGKSDILWQNSTGPAAIWLMNGLTPVTEARVGPDLGPSWKVIGSGDFDGDGKSDILWQNSNGQAEIWLMNGTNVLTQAALSPNPGASWKVIGTGDFNGDGKADILWQDASGQPMIWLMDGTTVASQALIGSNPGTDWTVKGAADINGDGRSDVLLQNSSGLAGAWLMSGTTILSNLDLGTNPGSAWHLAIGTAG